MLYNLDTWELSDFHGSEGKSQLKSVDGVLFNLCFRCQYED